MRTGIAGFDDIADGGLPTSGVTVVLGGAGAGKTIFGMQVLAHGARVEGVPGILVAFEESAARIRANTATFSWGRGASDVVILDAQLAQSVETGGEFDLLGLLAVVGAKAKQIGARRIVFDGLDVLLGYLNDPALVRREAFRLRDWVHASGLSAIVTVKASADSRPSTDYEFFQFVADCVVVLHHRVVDGAALRFVRIAKYRGAAHSANELPLAITRDGIEIARNTTIELEYAVSTERISTGVERLDAMLCGGYYRGTSVLISGAPGTAKSSLAATFAAAAALRGEQTLYVSLDEAPDQLVRNMASIGISLQPQVDAGLLRLYSLRGHAESPATQVARIRALVRELQPRNLVVDPLSALAHHGTEANRDDAPLQILDLAKTAGITVVNTSLLANGSPLAEKASFAVSTIADVWMHVSYVSQGGERNRSLTIIKARGTGHSNQVRELVLSDAGVTLADVYAVDGEVLMGTLRWEKENQVRRNLIAAHHSSALRKQKAELALAEIAAQQTTLARARGVQEAELAQLLTDATLAVDQVALEADELLTRRGADIATSKDVA